jgi:hypothetical protein
LFSKQFCFAKKPNFLFQLKEKNENVAFPFYFVTIKKNKKSDFFVPWLEFLLINFGLKVRSICEFATKFLISFT